MAVISYLVIYIMAVLSPYSRHLSRKRKKQYGVPLSETLLAVKEAEALFTQLKDGQLLTLNASPHHGHVRIMIDKMIAANVLPEDAGAYYNATLVSAPHPHNVRKIGYDPLPETLLLAKHQLETELGMVGSRALHILGSDYDVDYGQDKKSALKIAVPGRIETARQLLKYMRRGLEDKKQNPIIIENDNGFWQPLLKLSGLMASNSDWIIPLSTQKKLGLYISNTREETIAIATDLIERRDIKAKHYPHQSYLPKNAVLFAGSGTAKKILDLQSATKQLDVTVLPIDVLVDFYSSPNETSGTYQGNAAEKIGAAIAAWQAMPPAAQNQALSRLGLEAKQGFVLVEDSGVDFAEPDLHETPQFEHIRHLFPMQANFPGVETGPAVWGGGGVPDFVYRATTAIQQRAELRGEEPNLAVKNISVIAIAPLAPDSGGNRPIIMSFAKRDTVLNTQPAHLASQQANIDLSDYLYPTGSNLPERLTPMWSERDGHRAAALCSLLRNGGSTHSPALPALSINLKPSNFQATLYVPDSQATTIGHSFRMAADEQTLRVMPYPPIQKLEDVQILFAKPDAILLGNPPQEGDYAYRFALYGYVFFSLMVANQTRDKFTFGKMAAIMLDNPSADDQKIVNALLDITHDLHRLGAIPQEPSSLFKTIENTAELATALEKAKAETLHYPPFSYAYGPEIIQRAGQSSTKDYHVAILLSATVKDVLFGQAIRKLAEGLCEKNMGALTGAGLNNGGMGIYTDASHQLLLDGKNPFHYGVTTPHVAACEASGNVAEKLQLYELVRNIHIRKEKLANADTSLAMRGGSGTLEEMFAKMLLQEIARQTGGSHLQHHLHDQTIWVNERILQDGRTRGFYDVTLHNIPEALLERSNASIVSTVPEALTVADTHRRKMRSAGRTTSFTL